MKKALGFLAAIVALAPSCATPNPLNDTARTAAVCLGWPDVARQSLVGLTTRNELQKKLGLDYANTAGVVGILDAFDIVVTKEGQCGGNPLPSDTLIRYPADFDKPHASAVWVDGRITHVRILVYLGKKNGGDHFVSLSGDLGLSPS